MKRIEIVQEGAQYLFDAEHALDDALMAAMTMGVRLATLRKEAKLSMVVGQDAMSSLIESISMLGGARGAMVRMHGQLDSVKTMLGCQTVAIGTTEDKPGGGGVTNRRPVVVASAAA